MRLEEIRREFHPVLPKALRGCKLRLQEDPKGNFQAKDASVESAFPHTFHHPLLWVSTEGKEKIPPKKQTIRVGVVFSGGQAPGGHNVIAGIFDALQERFTDPTLIGFIGGPEGILENQTTLLTKEKVDLYRNQGGFDLLGSGRTKIEGKKAIEKAYQNSKDLRLQGLVIIGGDDSNTNAAVLAEAFSQKDRRIAVIGVPKTIDGDLQSDYTPISFGFHTATSVYAEMVGNIAKDASSAKKYYHFIRLMGRSASHVTLECALKTQPNFALISEECLEKKKSVFSVVEELVSLIKKRANQGKYYGVILIPEGLLEFLTDMKQLISSINEALFQGVSSVESTLQESEKKLFSALPKSIQKQLLMDRDPHGNVQVSKISTEGLLVAMVEEKLRAFPEVANKFHPASHFFVYEGRASLPSNFDANYCYSLGKIAALLLEDGKTGYMASLLHLHKPVDEWQPLALPIAKMLHTERRKGKEKLVIAKALVCFSSEAYQTFAKKRGDWELSDAYLCPGPMQFFGPSAVVDAHPFSLRKPNLGL